MSAAVSPNEDTPNPEVDLLSLFDRLSRLTHVVPLSLAPKSDRVRSSLLNAINGQRINLVVNDTNQVCVEVMGGGSPAWTQILTLDEARKLAHVWKRQTIK